MSPYSLIEPKKRILLIRHGQAEKGKVKRYIGQTEISLTPEGSSQAESLAERLSLVPLTRIVCSDLQRSRQTAEIIARKHGLAAEQLPGLREINLGVWEGLSFAQVKAAEPELFEERGRDLSGFRPPAGESFADLQARVVPVFAELLSKARGNVALVGHAGVNRVILCHYLGIPLQNMFLLGQNHGFMSILEERTQDTIRLLALNISPKGSL